MDDIKEIKKEIWRVKQVIETEEKLKADWDQQFEATQKFLEADPHNQEVAAFLPEFKENVDAVKARLKPLYEKLAGLEAQLPQAPEVAAPKFDPEKHPLLKKTLEKTEPAKPVVYNTGDMCEAQWHDKSWYKAKIQAILGAASDPKYHVKFIEYDETMTVDANAVRPLQVKRKREEPAVSTAPVTSTPAVISGPVSVNPNAVVAVPDAETAAPRRKKIKNSKALAKSVANWKDFSSSMGKKVGAQKESMFRTGTNAGSRVGFTGSGSGMTEASKRVRYDNKADVAAEMAEMEEAKDRAYEAYKGNRIVTNPPWSPPPRRARY
ncbi:hypothetical protein P280DRAFT_194414 [Massarina eburnea CBS 473.64]|uniref:Tudor domain-containing protein n=1 Tax=Massarina eburnea CBS 473.64 TaxID=1395130 RepID=A0A6A6RJV7_9PLEO|nr:hypothetical protein P280DRAFT_194414 [Massarina eburnea CBS 473.64]